MIFAEVHFERVVVHVVLLFAIAIVASIADMATLVFFSAMSVELVVSVEAPPTKAAFRMSFEPALIYIAWIIIAELLVFP
jgi:hypothetical protein